MKERNEMGWNEVHKVICGAPFCKKQLTITKIMYFELLKKNMNYFCDVCYVCYECYKKGEHHFIYFNYPYYIDHFFDKIFKKRMKQFCFMCYECYKEGKHHYIRLNYPNFFRLNLQESFKTVCENSS